MDRHQLLPETIAQIWEEKKIWHIFVTVENIIERYDNGDLYAEEAITELKDAWENADKVVAEDEFFQ